MMWKHTNYMSPNQVTQEKCTYCERDAKYSTLSADYKNEYFCDECYQHFIPRKSENYIMVVNLDQKQLVDPIKKIKVEKVDITEYPENVREIYKDLRRFID